MHEAVAGTARQDITPEWPVMLSGFGQRTVPAVSVHDPIFAKALYLANGTERVLIITTDLLSIPGSLGDAVISGVGAATGLQARQICVCASHTHSAPVPVYANDGAEGIARYDAFLRAALVRVGIAAVADARPCRVRTGVGQADIFFNRRTRGNPNRVDRRVAVLAAEDAASGRPIAVLFGAGCHPVVMGWDNMAISADFTGHAQAAIERALGCGNALFFNTAQGNIVPITSPLFDALDPRGYCGGNDATAERLGAILAEEVLRVAHASTPAPKLHLAAHRTDLLVLPRFADMPVERVSAELQRAEADIGHYLGADFRQRFPARHLWSEASKCVIERQMAEPDMRRLMIACCYFRAFALRLKAAETATTQDVGVPMPVQLLAINDFTLLALPGEVLVESGEAWSAKVGTETAFVIALANGHHRYLPGTVHFAEPNARNRYETASAGLVEDAMDRAYAAAGAMLDEVNRRRVEPAHSDR
jgi:hypothetical protein